MYVQELSLAPSYGVTLARGAKVAPSRRPVLIRGDRGTGKTLLARYIHELSGRPGRFMLGPAPSIPDSLLQGELLGHSRGAFTDAKADKRGLLELAHGGTLFLDEIEAASYGLQAMLVGQVEQPELRRVGDARSRPVDVRFISASNADLEALVTTGRFRADLLDRLGYLVVDVPPLVQCREAILPLARRFITEELADLGRDFEVEWSVGAELLLLRCPWPGNIRDLRRACTEAALNLTEPREVLVEDFPAWVSNVSLRGVATNTGADLEREQVESALKAAGGNKSEAARLLGMTRSRLLRILERLRQRPGYVDQTRWA
jgi:DNA-binding NtrC family response regulator